VSPARFAGSWLLGVGAALMTLALVRGNFGSLALPFAIAAAGFLLLTSTGVMSRRFPGTDLELGLARLFALMLLRRKTITGATALAQELQLAGLKRGVRRWGKELQLITTDGYRTASRLSAHCELTGAKDDRTLLLEAVRALRSERTRAGADPALTGDPVSMLAYGLGARPAGADLTSLDDLLGDLGLAEDGDELRTHFDDILAAESSNTSLHLRTGAQRSMFRDLAGASFVLGAATRILELASPPVAPDTAI
jgi:hypothetical protein